MIKIKVDLAERSYPIFVDAGNLRKLGEMYQLYGLGRKAVVVSDATVDSLYGKALSAGFKGLGVQLRSIVLPAGEHTKSLRTIENIITEMLEYGCDRDSAVIGFGGGVIGDIAGFAASIFKRGVPFVQVPTTLLAQVDASVGGKTGVNHALGKNLIGTFYQPRLVWMDLEMLKTLPTREILCGLGEIIKYGVIWDATLLTLVEENLDKIRSLDRDIVQEIVKRCCEIKAEIVSQDEKEAGLRMILNFGHTVGHALEAATDYNVLNHGEAVLLGMLAESKIALAAGHLSAPDFERIHNIIAKVDLQIDLEGVTVASVVEFIKTDKKRLAGRPRLVLPRAVGEVFVVDNLDRRTIKKGIAFVLSG
ncbi:MAG: 3-dehydroquinate synthase [bacterium]